MKDKSPLSPENLVGAKHDTVHEDKSTFKRSMPIHGPDKAQAIAKEMLEWLDGYMSGVNKNIKLGQEESTWNVTKRNVFSFRDKFKQILGKHGINWRTEDG